MQHHPTMAMNILYAFFLIFCCYQACLANDLFYCDRDQSATLNKSFTVKCNSSSDQWRSVHYYLEGKEEVKIMSCDKSESCEEKTCVKGGSGYNDQRLNITAEGVLVFNMVTGNDNATYRLEYQDCNEDVDSLLFSIAVQPVDGPGSLWILVIISTAIVIIVGGSIVLYLVKKKTERKRKTNSGAQASYSAVKGHGESKVYNETTEEIA